MFQLCCIIDKCVPHTSADFESRFTSLLYGAMQLKSHFKKVAAQ